MDRRSFIHGLGLTTTAGLALSCTDMSTESSSSQTTPPAKAGLGIATAGLQLYTVRGVVYDDFERVIRRVAEIGYKELEMAGFHNLTPQEIRGLMDELQISAPSTHMGADQFRDNLDQIFAESKIMGHEYLICPHPGFLPYKTIDDYRAMAVFFNEIGAKCKAEGMQFAYHNHEFEFQAIDGAVPMEVLMDETDPELVAIELDLCWISHAGADAVALFDKYPGRFPLCHVKDLSSDKVMQSVGEGDIDFARIFARADVAGLKHYIVEHDKPENPIQSITRSYAHLTGS